MGRKECKVYAPIPLAGGKGIWLWEPLGGVDLPALLRSLRDIGSDMIEFMDRLEMAASLLPVIRKKGTVRVLDACSPRTNLPLENACKRAGYELTTMDIRPHKVWPVEQHDLLEPIKGMYDIIVSSDTLEHITKWRRALRNIVNSLSPEGVLILFTPTIRAEKSKRLDPNTNKHHHCWEISDADLRRELKACGLFVVLAIESFGFLSHTSPGLVAFRTDPESCRYSLSGSVVQCGVCAGIAFTSHSLTHDILNLNNNLKYCWVGACKKCGKIIAMPRRHCSSLYPYEKEELDKLAKATGRDMVWKGDEMHVHYHEKD